MTKPKEPNIINTPVASLIPTVTTSPVVDTDFAKILPSKPKKVSKPPFRKKGPSREWLTAVAIVPTAAGVKSWDIPMTSMGDIATGFLASFAKAFKVLSNGRAFTQWGEELCVAIGLAKLHGHKDVKGSDGETIDGKSLSIKSLTSNRGVYFQMSIFTGAGRHCSTENLDYSIRNCEMHAVVDITDLGHLRITVLPAQLLLDWMAAGLLTPSGFKKASEFYELLRYTTKGISIAVDAAAIAEKLREPNRLACEKWLKNKPLRAPLFAAFEE